MQCSAGEEHCCWVRGEPCQFLRENEGGRRWACGLRLELGSWEAVHADSRYLAEIRPAWDEVGAPDDCGDFPGPGRHCGTCGEEGG